MGYEIWNSRAIVSICDNYTEFYILSVALDRYPFQQKRNEVQFSFWKKTGRKIKKALRSLEKKGYITLLEDNAIQSLKANMDVIEREILKRRYGFDDEGDIEREMIKIIRWAEEKCQI